MNALRAVYLRVHLFFVLARPPLVVLLGTFAALGVAHAGRAAGYAALAHALLVVVGFVAFAVAINDLSDAAVDRINLPGDRSRPLASGLASTLEMRLVAIVGAAVSFAASAAIGWACAAITLAGLLLASAYSLPPFQLSKRGIVAPLILPFAFVTVPFLAGILAVRPAVQATDLWLLAGLYLGFIGRILLKDFRDLRGDALLGKRTFLVRRGRVWTCGLSAILWVVGSATLTAVTEVDAAVVLAYAVLVAAALFLLHALARSSNPHTDEALVAAIAIVGRGLIVTLLIHYGTAQAGTAPVMAAIVMIVVTAAMLVWAFDVARHGQATSSFGPDDAGFSATSARPAGSTDAAVTARAPHGR